MKIKPILITCILALSLNLSRNASAQATCFGTTFENFRFCMESSINACSAQFTACDSQRSLITLEDVANLATLRCCTKSTTTARNDCLTAERRRYKDVIGSFRNAISNTLKNIQLNNCSLPTPTVTPTATATTGPTVAATVTPVVGTPTVTATATATATATVTVTATATVSPTP